jgi:hypothetical protein
MSKACARATVPRLHVANWRQISVSISKEKFSAQERAYFDLENVDGVEDVCHGTDRPTQLISQSIAGPCIMAPVLAPTN